MNNFRRLAPAAYFLASLLVIIPLADALMTVMPTHALTAAWRFGAVGVLANTLLLPAMGSFLAICAAITLGRTSSLSVLRVACWIASLGILLVTVVFILDALQTRHAVRPELAIAFRIATTTAVIKLLIGAVTFGLLGRGAKSDRPTSPAVKGGNAMLLTSERSTGGPR